MINKQNKAIINGLHQLTFAAMFCFCLFIYSSNAASSLGHVFLILPGIYFTYLGLKLKSFPLSAYFLFLFIISGIISVLFAPNISEPFKKIGELRYFLASILSIWAFNAAFVTRIKEKEIRLLLIIIITVASIASINGIIGLYTGFNPLRFKPSMDPNRATGLYSMAITFGYGIQFMALIIAGLLLNLKKINKLLSFNFLLFGFIATFLGLYFSGSRGALLGFLIGIPFFFYRTAKKTFISFFISALIGLVIVTVIVFSGGSTVSRYFLPAKHDSNLIRISQYEAALYAIKERPLFGHGYRNFTDVSTRIKEKYNLPFKDFISHAHNNYLEIFAGSGIFTYSGYTNLYCVKI
jgi:O-antigen ligase